MKKTGTRVVTIVIAMALLLLVGCKAEDPAPAQSTPNSQVSITPQTPPANGGQTEAPAPISLQVASLKGPTGMGMVQLMQAAERGETDIDYTFVLAGAPDEITGRLIAGSLDIAAVPVNLAATLHEKTQGALQMIAVNTLGVLYVLENGQSVQSIADLEGKTIYATGQGSTPEYILQHLLQAYGISEQVTIQYYTEHAELATLLAAGEVDLAMLPEPNVTTTMLKNDQLRVALDLTAAWGELYPEEQLVQGCIVAKTSLIEENPAAIEAFLAAYAASTAYTNENPVEAAALIEAYGIMGSAAAAEKAIPKCNIVCMTGEAMKNSASAMLRMLYEANPQSVGGALPTDSLYYLG